MAHTVACTGRFVHLAKHHDRIIQHAGFAHFPIELLGFAASLTNATEQTDSGMFAHDVMDQLRDQYRLAHARTTKQPRLATAFQGRQEIDGLNAGVKDLAATQVIRERRRDWHGSIGAERPLAACRGR